MNNNHSDCGDNYIPQANDCQPPCEYEPPQCKPKMSFAFGKYSRRDCENPCVERQKICNEYNEETSNIGEPMQGDYDPNTYRISASGGNKSRDVDLNMTDPTQRKERVIVVEITTSVAEILKDPSKSKWVLTNDQVLKKRINQAVGSERYGNLSKTIPIVAFVPCCRSTAPFTLIASSPSLRGNVYSNNRRGFLCIFPGNFSHEGEEGKGKSVFIAHKIVTSSALRTYGGKSMEALKRGLHYLSPGSVLVPMNHEVAQILAKQPEGKLNFSLNSVPIIDDKYHVDGDLVENCLNTIKQQVHDTKAWSDMREGKFFVDFSPASGNWDSVVSHLQSVSDNPEYLQYLLEKKFTVSIELVLDYSILSEEFVGTRTSD